jgi:hypothetical protein
MNYTIITDEKLFFDFIEWLPELQDNECYYLCLFARSKYVKNTDGTNKFPHIKTDKNQLKRFTVSRKSYIYDKIRQLEVSVGAYKTKNNADVPQEALALYITPNPRNQKQAMFHLMRRLIDIQQCQAINYNIHAEALSDIQKSCSRKVFFDFDIDCDNAEELVKSKLDFNKINRDCVNLLKTRGGLHILIELQKISDEFKKSWYLYMTQNFDSDIRGDNMIPFQGTYQGGFTPYLLKF